MTTQLGDRFEIWGEKPNTHPDIPNGRLPGKLYVEDAALVFKGDSGAFNLGIPWTAIGGCDYVTLPVVTYLASLMATITLGLVDEQYYFVRVWWDDPVYDLRSTLWLEVSGWFAVEDDAITISKEINRRRGKFKQGGRKGSNIQSRK